MARKRGSIRKRPNGKYRVRVYKGRENGRRKYISETVDTHPEAQATLTRILRELDTGSYQPDEDLTVREFVLDYLEGKDVNEKTLADYKGRMERDIFPEFGDLALTDLSPTKIQRHLTALGRPPRNLSNRTRQMTYTIFKGALERARLEGLIRLNPMDAVDRPSVTTEDRVQNITVYSREEVQKLLEEATDTYIYPLLLTLLTTGLRPSEALALEWDDIDFEKGVVHVTKGLTRQADGSYEIGGLKSPSSYRTISLPDTTLEALAEHKVTLDEWSSIGQWDSPLVFPSKAGTPQAVGNVRQKWRKIARNAGLPEARLYDARHTHATHLLEAGVSPKAASNRLGHASTQMFLDVYTHLTETQEDELRGAVNAIYS